MSGMVMLAVVTTRFGEVLRGFRDARKIDRKVLASRAGVSYESIRRYEEEGRNPSEGNVRKLARALGEMTLKPLLEAAGYPVQTEDTAEIATLTDEERVLLNTYRSLSDEDRQRALRYWRRLVAEEE